MPAKRMSAPGEAVHERPHRMTLRLTDLEAAITAKLATMMQRPGQTVTPQDALRNVLHRLDQALAKGDKTIAVKP
jgi:hypothetical protein